MKNSAPSLSKQALPFLLPLLVVLSSVFIVASGLFWQQSEALAFGITYDLVLTAPLLYLFLIRNKKIPKITVVSFFVGGLLLAGFLLPEAYHFHINIIWTYFFPLVELALLSLLLYKTSQTIREYRKSAQSADFLALLRSSTEKVLSNRIIALIVSSEVAVFYYSLFSWKKRPALQPEQFSYHRQNGAPAVYGAIIFLLIVETLAVHIVAAIWSPLLAWIFTLSTVYACMQLFAHLRAMLKRPVEIGQDSLSIRYGLAGDAEVPFSKIQSVNFEKQAEESKETHHIALLKMLEPYNVAIHFKEPVIVLGMYGIEKKCTTLLLNIDQKEAFKEELNKKMKE
jgi:hypothetical protein